MILYSPLVRKWYERFFDNDFKITKDEFMEYIFDYKKNKDFVLKGDKPVVIDFWATCCGPCKKLAPVMDELAAKYKDRVVFYKVDADKEKELCSRFNIMALPYILINVDTKQPYKLKYEERFGC